MGYMVSNLYSLGRSAGIDQYLYITEPENLNSDAQSWLNNNFAQLGREIGSSGAFVRGYSSFVTEQTIRYLQKCLRTGKWREVCPVFEDWVTVVATKNILPSTESMVVIPVCKRGDGREVIEKQMNEIMVATRSNQLDMLLTRSGNIHIDQSDFQLVLTDWGVRFVRGILAILSIEIPFTPVKIKVSEIGERLLKNYPRGPRAP